MCNLLLTLFNVCVENALKKYDIGGIKINGMRV